MPTFNFNTVTLENSKLIEAGAGTGKTFSIAILTLRLIAEKDIPIEKILLVTFTEAAAAELEARIRKFFRLAYNHINGIDIGEDNNAIKEIIKTDDADVKERIGKALLSLDETSIGTIHSFCQKTLNAFAFETGQIYGAEPMQDLTEVITDEVNDYWRKNIAVLEKDLLIELREPGYNVPFGPDEKYLSRNTLINLIKESLSGKIFFASDIVPSDEVLAKIGGIETEISYEKDRLMRNIDELIARVDNYNAAGFGPKKRENLLNELNNIETFIHYIKTTTAQHTIAVFQEERNWFLEKDQELISIPVKCINGLFQTAIEEITPLIEKQIAVNNQLSFDDMIQNLHEAVCVDQSEPLKNLLREKFDAVFIDEFQDTDKHQYEIFNTLFGTGKILFYIGDPKQAIYSWRKADINTYFSARQAVGDVQTMDTNFRSTKQLVSAFNEFFGADGLDAFCNGANENKIDYFPVNPKPNASEKSLKINGKEFKPLTIFVDQNNNDEIYASVEDLVVSLLNKGTLKDKEIRPSSIAVIARTNTEGRNLKKIFERLSIPSILMFDEKIFNTDEAIFVHYLLEAFEDISINNIKKALLSPFTGFTSADITKLNSDKHVELFKTYSNAIQNDGVFACLSRFIADYKVREQLLKADNKGGQRVLSNLIQLAEVLQDAQQNKQLDLTELASFLKKGIDGMGTEGGEYVQRVETDNDALKIVTIHKSKGLEYDIVIAPFLDLKVKQKFAFSSFRDVTGEYKYATNDNLTGENKHLFEFQTEQENRRLLYVAVTRARFQCFLFKKPVTGKSSLDPFYLAINEESKHISKETYESQNEKYNLVPRQLDYKYPENVNIDLSDNNWCKMSFSFLGGKHAVTPKVLSTIEMGGYDKFIFQDLERGMNAGNLLHEIFEFLDFTVKNSWQGVIEKGLSKFLKKKKDEFQKPLAELLGNILNTTISIAGQNILLSEVSNSQKLNEMEFDINISSLKAGVLNGLSDEVRTIRSIGGDYDGVLNGLMDLFFEYNGKFYILDWKSNYLGDSLEDYTPDKLNEAMNENNYHLQYMIYTYAADRFLKSRLTDYEYEKHFGGVIYLFLRGVRKDKETGIFVNRPTKEELVVMERIFNNGQNLVQSDLVAS